MSVTFKFGYTVGSYDNIHDHSKARHTRYSVTLPVPEIINPTFADVLRPLSSCFTQFWRIVYAGNIIHWNDAIPPSFDGKHVHLVAPIGHWSRKGYAENFPIFALPHVDWIKEK